MGTGGEKPGCRKEKTASGVELTGSRKRSSNKLRSGSRRAGNRQMSAGHLHFDGFDSRLHGLGNIISGFTIYSLNRKKCSICNGFSVFCNQ